MTKPADPFTDAFERAYTPKHTSVVLSDSPEVSPSLAPDVANNETRILDDERCPYCNADGCCNELCEAEERRMAEGRGDV